MQESILTGHEKWKRAKRFPGCSLLFVGLQSSVIICEALIEYEIVFFSCCYSFLPHWGPQSPKKSNNNKWQRRSMPYWLVGKLTWLKVRFFSGFVLGGWKHGETSFWSLRLTSGPHFASQLLTFSPFVFASFLYQDENVHTPKFYKRWNKYLRLICVQFESQVF